MQENRTQREYIFDTRALMQRQSTETHLDACFLFLSISIRLTFPFSSADCHYLWRYITNNAALLQPVFLSQFFFLFFCVCSAKKNEAENVKCEKFVGRRFLPYGNKCKSYAVKISAYKTNCLGSVWSVEMMKKLYISHCKTKNPAHTPLPIRYVSS